MLWQFAVLSGSVQVLAEVLQQQVRLDDPTAAQRRNFLRQDSRPGDCIASFSVCLLYTQYERTLIGRRALQEGKRSAAKADRV